MECCVCICCAVWSTSLLSLRSSVFLLSSWSFSWSADVMDMLSVINVICSSPEMSLSVWGKSSTCLQTSILNLSIINALYNSNVEFLILNAQKVRSIEHIIVSIVTTFTATCTADTPDMCLIIVFFVFFCKDMFIDHFMKGSSVFSLQMLCNIHQ